GETGNRVGMRASNLLIRVSSGDDTSRPAVRSGRIRSDPGSRSRVSELSRLPPAIKSRTEAGKIGIDDHDSQNMSSDSPYLAQGRKETRHEKEAGVRRGRGSHRCRAALREQSERW